jgi:hypothetical protein
MDIPSLFENSAVTMPRDFSLVGIHEVAAIMPKKWYFSSRSLAQSLRVELSEFAKQIPAGHPSSSAHSDSPNILSKNDETLNERFFFMLRADASNTA